ncbi:hypothetical protein [Kumtagia ephedrae]|jgi:hypothetical protein|uniref:Uncharacterized protein n=1 Tax=Kumtagia ephedrae TaxID=2116701 RepID=A0A2P7RNF1_9HYPH|nr:hypothetical protein [Mesorhizobium ephedrae]PSJ51739.1 hypothetical protein C7I84_27055 [Mesorhizobium ephedrae]
MGTSRNSGSIPAKPDRAARLAEELRANLAKRKAQARSRRAGDTSSAADAGKGEASGAPAKRDKDS